MTEEIIQLKDKEDARNEEPTTSLFFQEQPSIFKRTYIRPNTLFQGRTFGIFRDFVSSSTTVASATTTTETALVTCTIPDMILRIGNVIRITARGHYSNTNGTSDVTIAFTVGTNPPTSATLMNQMQNTVAVASLRPWGGVCTAIVKTLGTSGTLDCQLEGAVNNVKKDNQNDSDITIDTTTALTFAVTAVWSDNAAGNTITIRQFILEVF